MRKKRDLDAYAEQLIQKLRQAKPEVIEMTAQLEGVARLVENELEEARAKVQEHHEEILDWC